jgi:hypothetical protein
LVSAIYTSPSIAYIRTYVRYGAGRQRRNSWPVKPSLRHPLRGPQVDDLLAGAAGISPIARNSGRTPLPGCVGAFALVQALRHTCRRYLLNSGSHYRRLIGQNGPEQPHQTLSSARHESAFAARMPEL